jgi:type IV secretory pathway TrbL component
MKNSQLLMYFVGIIATFVGMLIHINLMIETDLFVHFVCFLLWMIACVCLVVMFKFRLYKN